MKKTILSMLLLASVLIPVSGKNRVIDNPAYEVKNSGIDNIVKIELSKKETRVHVKTTFIPKWWVKFPKATFIQPEGSNEKIFATGIENGEFDKEIYMPASGDSLFVLVFPPLDKSVKKIDYGEDDKTIIFGVSLEKSKKQVKTIQEGIPDDVEAWLNKELESAKVKEALPDYRSDQFFNRQPSRLVGYIQGYDPRLGFRTGIIYTSNVITREDYPVTLDIHPDGRFEANIPQQYPASYYMLINDKPFSFYMEPGNTLVMILDWEEFLIADRQRNIRYRFKDFELKGMLAEINEELQKVTLKEIPWNEIQEKSKALSPKDYKAYELQVLDENRKIINQNALSVKSKELLNNEVLLQYATNLFEYTSNYRQRMLKNPDNQVPLPDDYYDFLQQIPMNDQSLLCASSVSVFINRFEFCEPFFSIWKQTQSRIERIQLFDSVLVDVLHLSKPNLIYDITKVRALESVFNGLSDETEANKLLLATTKDIRNPFVTAEALRVYAQAYPEDGVTTYDLPQTEAGKLFKEMITPLKGKYIIADFWESSCGPCVAGIKQNKELREKLKDSGDIAFLFICSEETPEAIYKNYVEEQRLVNSYRLTKDQYYRMRELFKFNGIPHYESVNREGKIMTKGLSIYNLEASLLNLLEQEKSE